MKKIIVCLTMIALALTCVIALSSCDSENEDTYFTITFDSKGGTPVQSQTVKQGGKATLPQNPTKEGYVFEEWNVVGDHSGYGLLNLVNVTEDILLEAVWSPISYNVIADQCQFLNGIIASFTVESGDKILPLYGGSHGDELYPGYMVTGWYLDSELSELITQIPKGTVGDVHVYPKLVPIDYTIEYFIDNVKYAEGTPSTYSLDSDSEDLPVPEKDGFLFSGWLYAGQIVTTTKQLQEAVLDEIQQAIYNHGTFALTTWNLNFSLYGNWVKSEPTEYEKTVNALLSRETDGLHLVLSNADHIFEYDEDETSIYCVGNPFYEGYTVSCKKDDGAITYIYLNDGQSFSPIYGKQTMNLGVFSILQVFTGNGVKTTYVMGNNKYPALQYSGVITETKVNVLLVNKEDVAYIVMHLVDNPAAEAIYKIEDIGNRSAIPSNVSSFYDEKNTDHLYFLIQSDSMNPMFKVGEYWLFDTNLSEKTFTAGDVIAFNIDLNHDGQDEVCIHRIVAVTDKGYITKGDNNETNPFNDDWVVSKEQIIGYYMAK